MPRLPAGQIQAQDYHALGVMFFAAKDFAAAASAFELARKQQADFPDVSLNLGLCLILTERPREAIPELLKALEERPDSLDATDGLAHAYGKLGDFENSRIYGEKSLQTKDRMAKEPPPGFHLPEQTPPPFRIDHAEENVIAFSLFGNQQRVSARGSEKRDDRDGALSRLAMPVLLR